MLALTTILRKFSAKKVTAKRSNARRLSLESLTARMPMDASGLADLLAEGEIGAEMPDFNLPDVNPNSVTSGQRMSPHAYMGGVSAWYFVHAT